MQEFLVNIDNKEIFSEILNHSIDFLIENCNEDQTLKMCHKYGFQNPDDFLMTTRKLSKCYQNYCTESGSEAELLADFNYLNPDFQCLIPAILNARKSEVLSFLLRLYQAEKHPLIESFHWDVRFLLGDSISPQNQNKIVTLTLQYRTAVGKKNVLHMEIEPDKLDEFIETIQKSIKDYEQ